MRQASVAANCEAEKQDEEASDALGKEERVVSLHWRRREHVRREQRRLAGEAEVEGGDAADAASVEVVGQGAGLIRVFDVGAVPG